jgi:hypothetical protein
MGLGKISPFLQFFSGRGAHIAYKKAQMAISEPRKLQKICRKISGQRMQTATKIHYGEWVGD